MVNDLVLKELNRYIGTPDGREFMRNSLTRMETYRGMIQTKLDQYQLPPELMAIPITESGYQNLAQDGEETVEHGAGLWMFIQSTARRYGMRVDATTDDRLNPADRNRFRHEVSGRALNLEFRDWLLAVFSYNTAEHRTEAGNRKNGLARCLDADSKRIFGRRRRLRRPRDGRRDYHEEPKLSSVGLRL